MSFCNLHAHSEYSLLSATDGAGTPKQRAKQAVELKQSSLSISDHGNLAGVPHHINACEEFGIKPIVGVEAYFKPDRNQKDKEHRRNWHLLLLAKNEQGWKNLIKLTSEAYLTGFYHYPNVDWELLEKYHEGIIASSACVSGYIPSLISEGTQSDVANAIEKHLQIFGRDFRLEIMPHDIPEQKVSNIAIANLSLEYDIPLVATIDSHYPYANWIETHDAITMIKKNLSLTKREKKLEEGKDAYDYREINTLHFMSEAEVYEAFKKNHPDLTREVVTNAIEESGKIADSVEPFNIDKTSKLPKVTSSKEESKKILQDWCDEGLRRIGKSKDDIYRERMVYELSTLEQLEVLDYFVLVGRMVRWARSEGIRISSGRGSAAGSLVCYLTHITTIDPIAHKLLFERFINPNRKGMPDIDLDFQDDRRDEVKKWLAAEYGEDKVSNIAAIGTFGPKGAVKDIARVLNVSYPETNVITKLIPDPPNVPDLETLRSNNEAIREYMKKYPEVWKHAHRIEGSVKQLSQHAGGVVVCNQPITDFMPLMQGKKNILTAWSDRADAPIISEYGFVKIDILSIDGLTKQGKTIATVEEMTGEKIDLDKLPVVSDPSQIDPKVMEIFQRGLTLGVWQFGGSKGITNFLRKVKPDRFEDLVAVNALYRPAGLGGGDAFDYGDRKQGKAPITYWHEAVESFLAETYGILVYQEQMMEITKALGNFTPSQADDMRKACSKLYRVSTAEAQEFMSQYLEQWQEGCLEHGIDDDTTALIWDKVIAFGGYSFNKSHASSYALLAYQDAYLKAYHTLPFYSSLLSGEEKDIAEIVREAGIFDLEVLPPDINRSKRDFTIDNKSLLYGLLKVKYVGDKAIDEILGKRPFESPEDMYDRCNKKAVDSRARDNLIDAGAFDFLGFRENLSLNEKRDLEKVSLGVAISGTGDSSKYAKIIEARIDTEDELESKKHGDASIVGGEISGVKEIKTKKGQPMAFLELSFKHHKWNVTVFPREFSKYKQLIAMGNTVMIRGRKDDRGSVNADAMVTLKELEDALNG